MAENRAAKLQKLNHFRRKLPHVSANALASIATAIAGEGAPDGLQNRNELRAARNTICKTTGPYGPILDHASVSGNQQRWDDNHCSGKSICNAVCSTG